jgi:hypothetical protein
MLESADKPRTLFATQNVNSILFRLDTPPEHNVAVPTLADLVSTSATHLAAPIGEVKISVQFGL